MFPNRHMATESNKKSKKTYVNVRLIRTLTRTFKWFLSNNIIVKHALRIIHTYMDIFLYLYLYTIYTTIHTPLHYYTIHIHTYPYVRNIEVN